MRKKEGKQKNNFINNIKYIYKLLFKRKRSYIFWLPFLILMTILITAVTTFLPSTIVYLIESNFSLENLLLIIIGLTITLLIFNVIKSYLDNVIKIGYTITRAVDSYTILWDKCFSMDYQEAETKENKDKFMKAENAVGSNYAGIEGMYVAFPELVISLLGVLIYGILTVFISPIILLIVLAAFFINILLMFLVRKKDSILWDEYAKNQNKIRYFSITSESEKAAKDIRNYSLASKFKRILDSYVKILKKYQIKINFLWFLPPFELSIFALVRDLVSYAILIYQAINGTIGASEFVALLALVTAFNNYVDQASLSIDDCARCNQEITYFLDYLKTNNDFNYENKANIDVLNKPFEIEIKNLSFKYEKSDEYIFKDLNLKINSGEKVALVGINGAGKTTLAKLLVGLYSPTEGEILVNGHNINDFNINDYYDYVSIVNQEVQPLAFTIKDNIICSYKFDKDKFNQVLLDSGFKEKVDGLKDKENTFITQNFSSKGINLSGGETQKMLLARAIYKKSSFLILDEPTSALDPLAEGLLYQKYNDLCKDKTSIFISHRLSSTRFCERIYYLENGKIVEMGTHDELMSKKGKYFEMFNVQSKYYKDGEGENDENDF